MEAYCQYLAGLWHIFSAIEEQSLKAGEPVSQLDDVKLHRREVRDLGQFELCRDQVKGMVELLKLKKGGNFLNFTAPNKWRITTVFWMDVILWSRTRTMAFVW